VYGPHAHGKAQLPDIPWEKEDIVRGRRKEERKKEENEKMRNEGCASKRCLIDLIHSLLEK
jgi:hypothetical protein